MYKVEFNKSELENKTIPFNAKCILAISLEVEAYEFPKIQNILQLINKNFSECFVILGDSLKRHNYVFHPDHTAESYKKHCDLEGEKWINRNLPYFEKELKIPYKILRWDYFINHKDYLDNYSKMEILYKSNHLYKKVLTETTEEFLVRQHNIEGDKGSVYFNACLNYLKEESAAMCSWPELGCEYEIYFNKRNGIMRLVYEDLLRPVYPTLLQPLSLRFKKRVNPLITEIAC